MKATENKQTAQVKNVENNVANNSVENNVEKVVSNNNVVYDYVDCPTIPYHIILRDKKVGFMRKDTKEVVVDCICDKFYEPSNGYLVYESNGKFGILGTDYVVKTEPIFDDIEAIDIDELVKVRIGNQYGFVTEDGLFTTDEDEAAFVGIGVE